MEDLNKDDFIEEHEHVDTSMIPMHEGKYVPIELIKVSDRIREDMGEINELAESIKEFGLLHPICIDKDYNLVAGERRLTACKRLGLKEIRVQFLEELDNLTKKQIELEENLRRKDFTWIEEITAKAEINKIMQEIHGKASAGRQGGWGLRNTADLLDVSLGGLSQDIELAEALQYFPELALEKSKTVAHKKYHRMLEDRIRLELSKRGDFAVDKANIILGDAYEELKKMEDESIDLIYTDPPWGVNVAKSMGSKRAVSTIEFNDSTDVFVELVELCVEEWYRVLRDGRFIYIWFGFSHYQELLNILNSAKFTVRPVPIIWDKQMHGGVLGQPKLVPSYEPCIQAWKGAFPGMEWSMPDLISVTRTETRKRIYHPLEHPVELDRKIIEASTRLGDVVLDCFAGGGTVYEACVLAGRVPIVIEESPEYHAAILERAANIKLNEEVSEDDM